MAKAMITLDEFRDAVTIHIARSRRLVWMVTHTVFLLFACVWLAALILVPESLGLEHAVIGLTGLGAVAGAAVVVVTLRNEGRLGVDLRLVCPRCGRPFPLYGELVLETGNCPRCGSRVLANWEPPAVVQKRDRDPRSMFLIRANVTQRHCGRDLAGCSCPSYISRFRSCRFSVPA